MNNVRTFVLMAALTALLVFIGSAIGGRSGMYIAFGFALLLNFGSYWFSDKLVLRMYHATEVNESQAPQLYIMVRSLATRAELPMPKVYIIPGDQPNAFATGRNPEHAAVAVTEGIQRLLTRDELSGVIGHELAHIKNRDILIGTIAATVAGAISMLANMAQWAMIFGGGRNADGEEDSSPLAGILMIFLAPIAAFFIQMAISRSREYIADADGARIAGNPRYLSSALRKLHNASQQIPMAATPATAHMFIVSPLSGGAFMSLFSTHPPMEKRVEKLESLRLS